MNNVLLWIGGVLVVVLCALFAVPHFVNWNLYRGAFEEEASRLLARDVRVAGGVSVRFLPVPYVSFEKVRIGEATVVAPGEAARDGAERPVISVSGEPVLRVERFTMGLSITDLMRGSISAHEVEMVRPEVRVGLGDQGASLLGVLAPVTADVRGTTGSADKPPTTRPSIAIDTLIITDGTITVLDISRADALVVTAVNGEISQISAGGAPKFRGTATVAGEARDVRIATSDAGGGVLKVKSAIRSLGSATTYAFDGTVSGLQGTLEYDGEISAKLPVGSLNGADGSNPTAIDGFELKGRVKGGAKGLGADDLALSFERDGRPQTINGNAKVTWGGGTTVTADFASRWLDLDRIFMKETGARPVDVANWLGRSLAGIAPVGTRLAGTLELESLTLGAEQLTNVAARLAAQDGAVRDVSITARVPSGRMEITGRTSEDRKSFQGRVFAKAQSARRLLGWLANGTGMAQPRVDGTLLVDAAFSAEPTSVTLTDVAAELGGQPVRGGLTYAWTTRPTLRLDIAADRLSVGSLLPQVLTTDAIKAFAGMDTPAEGGDARTSEIARLFNPRDLDLAVSAQIGEIDDGETQLSDVAATLSSTTAGLQIDRLGFRTTAGAVVTVRGRVASAASDPRGALTIDASADTPSAIGQVLALAPVVLRDRSETAAPSLAPLRISAAFTLGEEGTRRDRVVIDGSAASSRIYGSGVFERGLKRWATERIEAYGVVAGRESSIIATLFAPSPEAIGPAAPSDEDRMALRLAGVPRTGMQALAGLTLAGASGAFEGRVEIPADGPHKAAGRVAVLAGEARQLAAWAGVSTFRLPANLAVSGALDIEQDARGTSLKLVDFSAGGVAVGGAVSVVRSSAATATAAGSEAGFTADLIADRVALSRLFEPFLLGSAGADKGGDGLLPDAPFDVRALTASRGRLTLAARELAVDADMSLKNARLVAVMGAAGLEVSELSGEPLGGRLSARFKLQPEGADVAIGGSIKADGLSLGKIGGGSSGMVGAELAFAGHGLTPRSLLQFVTGSGTLTLANVVVAGVEPTVVSTTVARAAAGDQLAEGNDISALVAEILAAGRLALSQSQVPVEIGNGTIKIADIRADTPQAAVRNRTTIDIVSLRTDIDWRITPISKDLQVKGRTLPGIGVVYAGPIAQVAGLSPRILSDELSRELSLRRLERSVDELERLRRQDEERARNEAERRRRLEEEQAAAVAAAAEAAAATANSSIAAPSASPAAATAPAAASSTPAPTGPQPSAAASPPPAIVPPVPQPAQRRSQRPSGEAQTTGSAVPNWDAIVKP